MPTALERAIDSLSDPGVSTSDALRGLLVVSRRIKAEGLTAWVTNELNGYSPEALLPDYRSGLLPIMLQANGPFGSSALFTVTMSELPDPLNAVSRHSHVLDPVAEIEALAGGEGDPQKPLPTSWVMLYREHARSGRVPSYEGMVVNTAGIHLPRTLPARSSRPDQDRGLGPRPRARKLLSGRGIGRRT